MNPLEILNQNKILAIIIIFIIVVVVYSKYGNPLAKKEKTSDRKSSRSSSRSSRSSRSSSRNSRKQEKARGNRSNTSSKKSSVEDDDSSSSDDDLREDAEELYNLVHDGMCTGMQQSEFEQAVDDLADSFTFIELKQLYNQCIEKNMDPEKAITVDDYIRILKNEN